MKRIPAFVPGVVACLASCLFGQVSIEPDRPWASVVIVPQVATWPGRPITPRPARNSSIEITGVDVEISIVEQVARTRMDIALRNVGGARQEAEVLVPVPDGVVVRGLDFQGSGSEPSAQLLPKAEARRIYEQLVGRVRDPALLEFSNCNLVRTSVFPVEARGTQKIRLTYEQLLPADGDRVDYVLPRSESLDYRVPWTILLQIDSKRPITTVYSSSHELQVAEKTARSFRGSIAAAASTEPGPFRLSYLLRREGWAASLMAYPDPAIGGGYFLLLAGVPETSSPDAAPVEIPRELTLVIDRSGSMSGEKVAQVQEAARQIVGGLRDGESFNIIAYNDLVQPLAPSPLPVNAANRRRATEFIANLRAEGGTNLHGALVESLRPAPAPGALPLVLFMTDGLPTVGVTQEPAIRNVAAQANPHHRRVFTIGVGVDVNAPLLDKIADETRAVPTLILPGENVEVKVAGVFKRLSGPVLTDPAIAAGTAEGLAGISDVLPARLPDIFLDDQLVVLGRYTNGKRLTLTLTGSHLGTSRSFEATFNLENASVQNAFVARLWASRRIAMLIDAIRQMGADETAGDPRLRELIDEVVRLSLQYGILTEYTAFLAREGTDLSRSTEVVAQADRNLRQRAMKVRSGKGAANQSFNLNKQSGQKAANLRNTYVDESLQRVSITNVQQVKDRALFNRDGRWIEVSLAKQEAAVAPKRTIAFGSQEYFEAARQLVAEGRQGVFAVRGEVVTEINGEVVLIGAPTE